MSVRVRTHANPLRRFENLEPPVFPDPTLPFALEFGSSGGSFLLAHAMAFPEMNILGTEIRYPLVESLAARIAERNLMNAHIVYGNIAGRIRDFAPAGVIARVYIFFPDPWPKKKHHKRRVINPALLDELAPLMPDDAAIQIMTDHEDLRVDIVATFEGRSDFREVPFEALPFRSDWEEHCLRTNRKYSRFEYRRR